MYGSYSDLYARWCDCYDPDFLEIETLKKYCNFRGSDVLDVGCGTGRFMLRVLPEVNRVVGVDVDSESLEVLNRRVASEYRDHQDKVEFYCSNIADFCAHPNSFDLVFFTWSFYALNRSEMLESLSRIVSMLRKNGQMVILQPTGGEFEKVMRLFFAEHEDMDEYDASLALLDEVVPDSMERVAVDMIRTEFAVSDLTFFADVLKMFAITEGGCTAAEVEHIAPQYVADVLAEYRQRDGYRMSDEVTVFVFRKR